MIERRRLGGIVCPIATPLTPAGKLDREVLQRHLDWLTGKVDGILLLGTSGEFATLPPEIAADVVRIASTAIAESTTLYVGVGDTSTARVLRNVEHLPERTDYAVACGPYYFPAVSQLALAGHFAAIADRSPRPLVLYNIPQNVGASIQPATVRELAEHPNIDGIKDSAGDMMACLETLALAPSGFAVMQGREQLAAVSIWAGAAGIVSSLANLTPDRLRALAEAISQGDRQLSRKLQIEISDLARIFEQGHWLAAMKAALQELGLPVGDPLPPLSACTPDQRSAIRAILSRHEVHSIAVDSAPRLERAPRR